MINFDHGYSLALIDSDHEHDIYILSHGQNPLFQSSSFCASLRHL